MEMYARCSPDAFFVLEEGDEVIGYCVFRVGYRLRNWRGLRPSICLFSAAIAPERIGRKMGSGMLRRALEIIASQRRDPFIYVLVEADSPAVRFYERLGFVRIAKDSGGAPGETIAMVLDKLPKA